MNMRRAPLLILLLSGAAPVHAAVSIDEAVKLVEQRYHARVVKVETEKGNGHTVYVLRVLNDTSGKVWTVRVDAASGALQ